VTLMQLEIFVRGGPEDLALILRDYDREVPNVGDEINLLVEENPAFAKVTSRKDYPEPEGFSIVQISCQLVGNLNTTAWHRLEVVANKSCQPIPRRS
jgi:hypothetical protein